MNFEVFISYSHEDKIEAELLCKALDKAGVTYWIDRNIHGSANFLTEITEKIRQCKVVIFIASSSSAKSIFTQKEILFAFKHNKTIVPYKLENFTFEHNPELDFLFTNIQWIEELEDVVADVYKLCYNKEYPHERIQTTNFIKTFYKKYCKVLLLCAIMIITAIALLTILNKHQDNNHLAIENEDENIVAKKEKSRLEIIEEFEKQDELPVSERVDIVDLIEAFIIDDGASYNVQSWRVFSEFTKNHQLIPLSEGLEWLNDDNVAPCKLEFIAKLTYNGQNLDVNIFGQSEVQSITLYGARCGASLLAIDTLGVMTEECDAFNAKDLKFSVWASFRLPFWGNYTIYKRGEYWLLEINENGGARGEPHFQWLVSTNKDIFIDYIKYIEDNEHHINYLNMAMYDSNRFGWYGFASYYDKPEIIGDISTLLVEHRDNSLTSKDVYTFNDRGDVISCTSYNKDNIIWITEYEYEYEVNNVKIKNNGVYDEIELDYINVDTYGIDTKEWSQYIYDDKGNIVEQIVRYGEEVVRHTKYTYNSENKVVHKVIILNNSNKILYTYTYNKDGRIATEVIGEGTLKTTTEYKYDERGNVTLLTKTSGTSSDWSQTSYTITYR